MIVYLAGDIPQFVMYCIYGESGSYLLIESTDSMISKQQESTCVVMEQVFYIQLGDWLIQDLYKPLSFS